MPETTTQAEMWTAGRWSQRGYFFRFEPDRLFTTEAEALAYCRTKTTEWKPLKASEVERAALGYKAFLLRRQLENATRVAADKDEAGPRLLAIAAAIDHNLSVEPKKIRPGWLSTKEGQDMLWEALQLDREIYAIDEGEYHDETSPDRDDWNAYREWIGATTARFREQLKELTEEMVRKAGD